MGGGYTIVTIHKMVHSTLLSYTLFKKIFFYHGVFLIQCFISNLKYVPRIEGEGEQAETNSKEKYINMFHPDKVNWTE